MCKKLTTENFILKSKNIHGDKYDYSLTNYVDAHTKVKIICPNGHTFEQRAQDHYNGHGCVICSKQSLKASRLINIEDVKIRLTKKYNDDYIFNFENYKNIESKITCKGK